MDMAAAVATIITEKDLNGECLNELRVYTSIIAGENTSNIIMFFVFTQYSTNHRVLLVNFSWVSMFVN